MCLPATLRLQVIIILFDNGQLPLLLFVCFQIRSVKSTLSNVIGICTSSSSSSSRIEYYYGGIIALLLQDHRTVNRFVAASTW